MIAKMKPQDFANLLNIFVFKNYNNMWAFSETHPYIVKSKWEPLKESISCNSFIEDNSKDWRESLCVPKGKKFK